MAVRRVLITGVSRFLGLRLARELDKDDGIEAIVGVDVDEPPLPMDRVEFIRADIRSPLIARVIEAADPDAIVHTNIASSPGLLGGRSQMKENNVIGTMQLLAAAQRSDRVKKVVMRSSTAIYGYGPGEPSLLPEDHASRPVDLRGYAKDCADAEQYARDFGRRRSDLDLVILRTQNVVGPTVTTSMTYYLSLPVIPSAFGYDPRLQFLHEDDAATALRLALVEDCRGIYNVAAEGIVYLSQAVRRLGKVQVPLLLPTAEMAAGFIRQLGLVDFPADQLKLLLYGRVVSIRRARQAFGFAPKYTTEQTLVDFRDHRAKDPIPEPDSMHPTWERELVEYLKNRSSANRETV
jgi:UDP-glucose 4-epimerase